MENEILSLDIGSDGIFRFEKLNQGKYDLEIDVDKHEKLSFSVEIFQNRVTNIGTKSLLYNSAGSLTVKLDVSLPENETAEGASVVIEKLGITKFVDDSGQAVFGAEDEIKRGTYRLKIFKEKYHSITKNIFLEANEHLVIEETLVYELGFIEGYIRFPEELKSGTLTLKDDDEFSISRVIDGDSSFSFHDIEKGEYTLILKADGHDDLTIPIEVNENSVSNVGVIEPSYNLGKVYGYISPNKGIKSGFSVKLLLNGLQVGSNFISDSAGFFTFSGISTGNYEVTVEKDNYFSENLPIHLEKGELKDVGQIDINLVYVDTIILKTAPEKFSNDTTPTFEFSCYPGNCEYTCRIDNYEPFACGTTDSVDDSVVYNLPEMADGQHWFEIMAKSGDFEEVRPAEYYWTVDTRKMDITIVEKPLDETSLKTASFSFITDETASLFQCSIDDILYDCADKIFTAENLAENSHSYKILAKDMSGNETEISGVWNIIADKNIYEISTGGSFYGSHSCVIENDLTLKCFGDNNYGQIGIAAYYPYIEKPAKIAGQWKHVSIGRRHTCAIKNDSSLWCWGDNKYGQLGNGSFDSSNFPARVGDENSWMMVASENKEYRGPNVSSVEFKNDYTCGLKYDGTIWCWGKIFSSQIQEITPLQISENSNWFELGEGVCAKRKEAVGDSIWCLDNEETKLKKMFPSENITDDLISYSYGIGFGKERYRKIFNKISKDSSELEQCSFEEDAYTCENPFNGLKFEFISSGIEHNCGVTDEKKIICWGDSMEYQMGEGMISHELYYNQRNEVIFNDGLTPEWIDINAGGFSTTSLSSRGEIYNFGLNIKRFITPQLLFSEHIWKKILRKDRNTFAFKNDGTVFVWGYNHSAELGLGHKEEISSATMLTISGETDQSWKEMKFDKQYQCGIRSDDSLWCWGNNPEGQLGTGDRDERTIPTKVVTGEGDETWNKIILKEDYLCGIKMDGSLWCWGENNNGCLGSGDTSDKLSPNKIVTGDMDENWKDLFLDDRFGCGLKEDDTLWCWGYNYQGQLGAGDRKQKNSPEQVLSEEESETWTEIFLNGSGTCGLKKDKTLWCWGYNYYGQLGLGDNETRKLKPVKVISGEGDETWKKVFREEYYNCGIKSDDSLWCWGKNYYGELGLGSMDDSNVPNKIITGEGDETWKTIHNHNYRICGHKLDNTLWCWGRNDSGNLGFTDRENKISPEKLVTGKGVETWKDILFLDSYTYAIKTDNTLWFWGTNNEATGTFADSDSLTPTQIIRGDSNMNQEWNDVNFESYSAFGIDNSGHLWSWGINESTDIPLFYKNPTLIEIEPL